MIAPVVSFYLQLGFLVFLFIVLLLNFTKYIHISSTRISSPAGGVEGAAASSFIDRLREGWRPCP